MSTRSPRFALLANYSPFGLAIGYAGTGPGHAGHLAISMFIGRRTRVAASQQFDVANRLVIEPPASRGGNFEVRPSLLGKGDCPSFLAKRD
ncbi:MAG TPA: hypothetical protein VFS13_17405, partial [Steroidobacteraceae bacterium]|nr:hypothetical protein [Steroidobacteraceae bacterium]